MSYIGNTPGVSSQRVVLEEVISGSPKSTFVPISGYIKGYVDVLINGSEIDTTDFTADDGVTVTLEVAAEVGDTVKIKTWLPRGLSDGYRKDEADAKFALLGSSYTKTEADAKYALLAAAYTKTESDAKYVQLYSGKAGVGTTTPAKLFVVSNGGANGIEFSPDDASTSNLNRILSYNRSSGAYTPLVLQGSEIRLYTKGGSADQSIVINGSGEVGIGGSAETGSLLRLYNGGTHGKVTIETVDAYHAFINYSAASSEFSAGFVKSDNSFRFCAYGDLTANERGRFDSTGAFIVNATSVPFGERMYVYTNNSQNAIGARLGASANNCTALLATAEAGASGDLIGAWNSASNQFRVNTSGLLMFNSGFGTSAAAYGCRAWVSFDGTGGTSAYATIHGSGNVSSVYKSAGSTFSVNFASAMPDANYSICGAGDRTSGVRTTIVNVNSASGRSTGSVSIYTSDGTGSTNAPLTFVHVFR